MPDEFVQLATDYPEEFQQSFGEVNPAAFAQALRLGKATYIAEGCWHCHSQYVRPVSSEDVRFGPVSTAQEYNNELNLPPLFGTRRVGPDLSRSSGKHSNDWHIAHFYDPRSTSPYSVMPAYPWFFDEHDRPNKQGLAITAYVQWLGSGLNEVPQTIYNVDVLSAAQLTSLLNHVPSTALRLDSDGEVTVPTADLVPGDRVRILPGQVCPVDGTVLVGTASVDESSLTGESQPITKDPGKRVAAGTFNLDGSLEVLVDQAATDSMAARIAHLLEKARAEKSPAEQLYGFSMIIIAPSAVHASTSSARTGFRPHVGFVPFALSLSKGKHLWIILNWKPY